MSTATLESPVQSALDALRLEGNPFRNYFARNPDDDVCSQFHVAELFAKERSQLLSVVDLYRATPATHSEMIPILGNKGAGKTHLLHSIKHGTDGAFQLLVSPGTYQKDTDFLEYLLFQVIDTLLGGGKQMGRRPLDVVQDDLARRLLRDALKVAGKDELLDLFPAPGIARWTRRLGLGTSQAEERTLWLRDELAKPTPTMSPRRILSECSVDGEKACDLIGRYVDRTEPRDTLGLMRRYIAQGFCRASLLGDECDLANFLTYGFAELDFKVQPSRQELVLSLLKALMGVLHSLKIPVVVAFDQLEDLLLARRADDGKKMAEAFFAGIVQVMHQIDGVCFLVFAERGLWNRFIPSLDGYIQDRLTNPIHVPGHGTLKALRLEAPPADLVRKVCEARLRTVHGGLDEVAPLFPFTEEQVEQIARTEPTLRDMLQQFRHLFDAIVFGDGAAEMPKSRIAEEPAKIRSAIVVETSATPSPTVTTRTLPTGPVSAAVADSWQAEIDAALAKLSPEGALTGATRELQLGLGAFLQTCHEHGVKVGPWRLQHVVPEFSFSEHPTYGIITIAHWACRDGQPWKVGIGLFMARGAGKPRDLETKLSVQKLDPPVVDHLILLRPDDDVALTGKSKTVWQDAEKKGKHSRLEAASLDSFAALYGFSRWLTALHESLPAGQSLPNLAELIQERCEKLLEQVCMPVNG
jgi:hypothetical protein